MMRALQVDYLEVAGRIGEQVRAAIDAEVAKGEADAAAGRARQANSLSRRAAGLAERARTLIREVSADHP